MNIKWTNIAVAFCAVAIIGLLVLGAYLTLNKEPEFNSSVTESAQNSDSVIRDLSSAIGDRAGEADNIKILTDDEEAETETETETEDLEWAREFAGIKDTQMIWVGDSRILGMQEAVNPHSSDYYIGASGQGYFWMRDEGILQLEEDIKNHPALPVIINLGVNDHENITLYLSFYEELMEEYPETDFYFLSVNPIDEEQETSITNQEIESFNAAVEKARPEKYLDCYTFLKEDRFETVDGLHYTEETYRKIYRFVKQQFS